MVGDGYGGQVCETVVKTCELFRKLANGYCGQGASERLNKLVKKARNKLRNRQQPERMQAYLFGEVGQRLQKNETFPRQSAETLLGNIR